MKYCESCNQNVMPSKKFSIAWFLINCLWIIGGGVYLIYFIFAKKKVCPICSGNQLSKKCSPEEITQINKTGKVKKTNQPDTGDNIVNWLSNFNKKMENSNERMKIRNEENARKRKAGELPWQIKMDKIKQSKVK